jgi:hypothetical protein
MLVIRIGLPHSSVRIVDRHVAIAVSESRWIGREEISSNRTPEKDFVVEKGWWYDPCKERVVVRAFKISSRNRRKAFVPSPYKRGILTSNSPLDNMRYLLAV